MANSFERSFFHPVVVQQAVRAFAFPPDLEERHAAVLKWVRSLKNGTLDLVTEEDAYKEFVHDVFVTGLGYSTRVTGEGLVWSLETQLTIPSAGKVDGVLGLFSLRPREHKEPVEHVVRQVVAPMEFKRARENLDRPANVKGESPVQQAWRYAVHIRDCPWVIVSNMRETRLYRVSRTPLYFHRFLLSDLGSLDGFKGFYYLLCSPNFLPTEATGASVTEEVLRRSDAREAEVTKELYARYRAIRIDLIAAMERALGPEVERVRVIEGAQKLLDRILFVSFAEDRGLLSPRALKTAHDFQDPFSPTTKWARLRSLFRWVDQGNPNTGLPPPGFPPYNGGLFRLDELLDRQLELPDLVCTRLVELAQFDYESDVSVEVLGHIFEQSITDLEELKASAAGQDYDAKKGKRKTQGVYYTPSYITQYLAEATLGAELREREQDLRLRMEDWVPPKTNGTATKGNGPLAPGLPLGLPGPDELREAEFWKPYRDEILAKTRILDPACGSGAFLIAAYDLLQREYARANHALAILQKGQLGLFDLNKQILTQNLYGTDISGESTQITRLSLWLKTAQPGKALTSLEENIRRGNSVVSDSAVDPWAADWAGGWFRQVSEEGGFDVVLGNPPYVRQELLADFKAHLRDNYKSFNGMADLYVYFFERGLSLLKPGGRLGFIVTNKWLRAGYGEELRAYLSQRAQVELIVDFGHSPIFEDADVFPCIVVLRKTGVEPPAVAGPQPVQAPAQPQPEPLSRICIVERSELKDIALATHVEENSYTVPSSRFGREQWDLENPAVHRLMETIKNRGIPLTQFAGCKPYRGVLTGLNEAFVVDAATRQALLDRDPNSAELLRPFLRGQDIRRWVPEWANLWMIRIPSSSDSPHAWSGKTEPDAYQAFAGQYPAVANHLRHFEDALRKRQDQGKYWWELRSCSYYEAFSKGGLIHSDITWSPSFAITRCDLTLVNTAYIWPFENSWTIAVLNSPTLWVHMWKTAVHGKDEALRLISSYVESLPIPDPTQAQRTEAEERVAAITEATNQNQRESSEVLEWLRLEMGVQKAGRLLDEMQRLSDERFVAEVRKRIPKSDPLTPKRVRQLQDVYKDYIPKLKASHCMVAQEEQRLWTLVNDAFGLTSEDVDLLRRIAPPRTPGMEPAE